MNDSFWKYQNLDVSKSALNYLLVQNSVTGCTMIINKKLVQMSKNIPNECIMHDWWIALLASTFGVLDYISIPTILYRQHGNNEVGAHKYNSIKFIKNKIKNLDIINKSIQNGIIQAKCFYNLYEDILSEKDKKILKEFYLLREKSIVRRKTAIINNNFYKSGLLRNISYFIFV